METKTSRRTALAVLGVAGASLTARAQAPSVETGTVERNDASVEKLLRLQVSDTASQWYGSVPDEFDLHSAGSAGGLLDAMTASLECPQSKFHGDRTLAQRIGLAAAFLQRSQSAEGFIDLLSTNFNSPPDTGFLVHSVATAAAIANATAIAR
jgi:hypothetical protein